MYQITAVLNPSVVEEVLNGLQDENIQGTTVINVEGKGCLDDREDHLNAKVMVIVVVADDDAKAVAMEAIRANAQDTEHGSGKMWVTPVLEVERIRTGEKNEDALSHHVAEMQPHGIDIEVFSAVDTPAS